MTKPFTFKEKIRLLFFHIEGKWEGVTVDCAYCHSPNVHFSTQSEVAENGKKIYKSHYVCKNCGAECDNVQKWSKN